MGPLAFLQAVAEQDFPFQWGNLVLGVVVVGGLFALIWWINRRKRHGSSKPTAGAEAKAPEGTEAEKRKSIRGKD